MNLLKTKPIRDKSFLKWVASLPCLLCGVAGASQAAHIHTKGQKAKGQKVGDNQAAPLCHAGANDCHRKVDHYEVEIDRDRVMNICNTGYGFFKAGRLIEGALIYRSYQ